MVPGGKEGLISLILFLIPFATAIVLASDHGAVELKLGLMRYISQQYPNELVYDLGTSTLDSVDYPDFADQLCQYIKNGHAETGILCCGTGIGMSIRANRYTGIRAAVIYDKFTAEMSKAHNNANVICLGGRTIDQQIAESLVSVWKETLFEGGRHEQRIHKLDAQICS